MTEKLKNCPFCGGEDVSVEWNVHNGLWHCICQKEKCHCLGPRRLSENEAIHAWNSRPDND